MAKRFVISTCLPIVVLMLAHLACAQNGEFARQPGAVYDSDKKGEKPAPAPRHDISGTWEPAKTASDATQGGGAKAMPSDGKPEHRLPYTPLGQKTLQSHKPLNGVTGVPAALTNDPLPGCDPAGLPRIVLHDFRTSQIIQMPNEVAILYERDKKWRVIWTDGRKLPEINDALEPRWWGYSVGKWVDDYTFVADTVGLDERTWVDNAGRPHSDALHVIEEYHRADRDHLEMTITIDDPKMYSKPWIALNKLPLRLQAPSFDIREMECVPSETASYNEGFSDGAAGRDKAK